MIDAPSWMSHLGVSALIALLPFVLIVGTSFAKIAIVLGIVRNALGIQGVPPASVISALAVVISIFIMTPVAFEIATSVEEATYSFHVNKRDQSEQSEQFDPYGYKEAKIIFDAAAPPLLNFLRMNTPQAEIAFFANIAEEKNDGTDSLRIMLPSFASAELVEAILIGFLVLIPFFVVDLLVANVLLALGMHMMSPTAVSLPFKLLLFLAVDGWHILVSGLLVSYGF